MKKILALLTIMGFVLAFGTAYAAASKTVIAVIKADSLINTLDPSKVTGYVELETGAITLPAAKPQFVAYGSAAGGSSVEPDTFLNFIDPGKVAGYVDLETGTVSTGPKAFTTRGSAAGGIGMGPDTLVNYIDPSRVPGYVNLETGAVN